MKQSTGTLYEDSTFKVIRRQNLRGKNRHNMTIELFAINKTTGKPVSLLELPEEVQALVNQYEEFKQNT